MINYLPNLSDLNSIKDLSNILITPMIIASYTLQTGLTVHAKDINFCVPSIDKYGFLVCLASAAGIVIVKGIFVTILASLFYIALLFLDSFTNFAALLFSSVFMIAFGIIGILAYQNTVILMQVHMIWWYTLIVAGFFLLNVHQKRNMPSEHS